MECNQIMYKTNMAIAVEAIFHDHSKKALKESQRYGRYGRPNFDLCASLAAGFNTGINCSFYIHTNQKIILAIYFLFGGLFGHYLWSSRLGKQYIYGIIERSEWVMMDSN